MGQFDCVVTYEYDAFGALVNTCFDCPEVPAVVASPEIITIDPLLGWNSSSYSALGRFGNLYTQFEAPFVVGAVCGFISEQIVFVPSDVDHGFYLFVQGGRSWYRVIENGVLKTAAVVRNIDVDVFRIERMGSAVFYYVNNVRVHVSLLPSFGEVFIGACMYAAGDGIY